MNLNNCFQPDDINQYGCPENEISWHLKYQYLYGHHWYDGDGASSFLMEAIDFLFSR